VTRCLLLCAANPAGNNGRLSRPVVGKVCVRIPVRAKNLVKFVLVLHLQLSLSIDFVLCTVYTQKICKVSHDKLPVIYL